MSEAVAKYYLTKQIINSGLKNPTTRSESSRQVSYFIISKEDIAKANKMSANSKKFNESYTVFIGHLNTILDSLSVKRDYANAHDAVAALLDENSKIKYAGVTHSTGTLFIFAKNYSAIGLLRTNIARLMPDDKIFGLIDQRTRIVGSSESQKKLQKYLGKYFVLKLKTTNKYGVYQVVKDGKEYRLSLKKSIDYFSKFVEKDKLGILKPPQDLSWEQQGCEISVNNDTIEKTPDGHLVLETRYLAGQHLGHIENEEYSDYGTKTIVGEKFSNVLDIISTYPYYSPVLEDIKTIIERERKNLSAVHSKLNFTFHNQFADIFNGNPNIVFNGKVITTVALISERGLGVNVGLLSSQEKKILERAVKDAEEVIANSILEVPGSNTLKQDIIEAVSNLTVSILSGKPVEKLKPHKKVKGEASLPVVLPKIKIQPAKGSGKSNTKKSNSYTGKQLRTTTGQFYGLAPLQRLLDASLVQRVKENMGTGSRRDILNLRTGRFAESVKVERLSQSREGMITAFYNYMKYPYATFSQGGRQEFPRSRDPKLLIAKSIREIGATMVANRMRAVLV